MSISKRSVVLSFSLLMLGIATIGHSGTSSNYRPKVKVTKNLHTDAEAAARQSIPVLLVFSAAHCPYCELLEEEILQPMLISGDYDDKVLIRKILIDEDSNLADFSGQSISARQFAYQHNVFVTPTMLFFDASGKELAKRMIGINTVELFGGEVDQAIDTSLSLLRQKNAKENPIAPVEAGKPS